MNDFIDWLETQMALRGWNQAELARRSSVSRAQISRVLSSTSDPGLDFCRGIAGALKLPEDVVFEKAGILTVQSDYSPALKEAIHLFSQMSDKRKEDVLVIMRALIKQEQQRAESAP